MRAFLPLCALLALQGLNAQIVITEKAAPAAQPAAAQDSASDALFFKAFYLAEGERKYDQAIDLYKQFLAAAPKSQHGPRAARSLVNLLYRTDKADAAEAAKKEFAALLESAVTTTPGAGEERPRGEGQRQRPGRGEGQGQGREGQNPGAGQQTPPAERIEARKRQIKQVEEELAQAKQAGDEERATRLSRQLERLNTDLKALEGGGAAGRQGRPGGQPGGGRAMGRPFAEMSQEEATQAVERMEGMVERIREMQGEEAAKRMEESVQKIKALVKEGKLAEADKARAEMMPGGAGGPGGGGRGTGRGMMRPLTEMTKEEALQSIERLEGMVDRIREGQGDEAAKKAEESIKKIKDLINEGKLEDAEKARQEMTRTMFRRGG